MIITVVHPITLNLIIHIVKEKANIILLALLFNKEDYYAI